MKDARGEPRAPEAILEAHDVEYFLTATGRGQDVVHLPWAGDPSHPRCYQTRRRDRPYRRREPGDVFEHVRLCRNCAGVTASKDTTGRHPSIDALEAMDPDEFPPGEA